MSITYSINAIQLIDSALRALGVLRSGDSSNSDIVLQNDCMQALNLMVKAWENQGLEAWVRETHTLTLTNGVSSYDFSNGGTVTSYGTPLRILQVYRTETNSSNSDVELKQISVYEYNALANKSSQGTPVQYCFDYQLSNSYIKLWPVPNTNTINCTVVLQREYTDITSNVADVEFPARWLDALKWNLAVRLAPEFGKEPSALMVQLAVNTLRDAIDAGYEEARIQFAPEPDWTRKNGR